MARTRADPADERAAARRNVGLPREQQQVRRADAFPARGGAVGYPEWFRTQQLGRHAAGLPTQVSASSIWRWQHNGGPALAYDWKQ